MSTRKQTAVALKAVDAAMNQLAKAQMLLSRAALQTRIAGMHDTAAELDAMGIQAQEGMRRYTDMLTSRVANAAG